MTRRLIEEWLPISVLGIESLRERTPMTPFPAPNRLHVWWARRPLVASRAAVLASLLPADADHDRFTHAIGIHGDPVASRRRIDRAKRIGERFDGEAYDYKRAFIYSPSPSDVAWIAELLNRETPVVVDPTAGGGSIPFESIRLGFETFANDLNPVAALIMKATIEYPKQFGHSLVDEFNALAAEFLRRREEALRWAFPDEPEIGAIPTNFIWARTITCPHCDGLVPLSPNWKLSGSGTGVRLKPHVGAGPSTPGRVCTFEIVEKATEHSEGTVAGGDATCPYPDCRRVVDGDAIKEQAQVGGMGEQLYCVVAKRRVEKTTKTGRTRLALERFFRAPRAEDENSAEIAARLAEKLPEWDALDILPNEPFPEVSNDDRPIQYGMPLWRDMFSPRQLLGHGISVETFRQMVEEDRAANRLTEVRRAAYVYLSFALDKLRDYNSRMTRWHSNREVMVNTFDRHDFAFKWSYAEMAIMLEGVGYDWAIEQTAKCIGELATLTGADDANGPLFASKEGAKGRPVVISAKSGAALDHIADASVDAVVMDPPYGANVMYAEILLKKSVDLAVFG